MFNIYLFYFIILIMIAIKIIVLFLFSEWIERLKYMKKYSIDTRFNVYRSLLCIYFTIYSLELVVNNFSDAYNVNFNYTNKNILNMQDMLLAYLLLDIVKLIDMKNKRWDLYFHHISTIIALLIIKYYDKFSYISILCIITEAISICSGFDMMYLEDNNKYESMLCKKYRKNIIQYVRLPIWILIIIMVLINKNNVPPLLFWTGLSFPIILIFLDQYWRNRCQKIIDNYEKN